jgi:hypothetical protein
MSLERRLERDTSGDHGLDIMFIDCLEEYITDLAILGERPTMTSCSKHLNSKFIDDQRLRSFGSLSQTKTPISSFLQYRKARDRGIKTLQTVHELEQLVQEKALRIPENYTAASDYKDVYELRDALG